ncbi:MAG: hypothetical protein H6Q67_1159 [Firmicutes bacterium]|nr:hypothetical protein [Bacillota bacterium]
MIEQFGYKQEFKRALSLRDLVLFGMTFMSPTATMTLFGIMSTNSQNHAVLSYIFGFIAMMFTALSYGKMVEEFPVAGSTYSYTQRAVDSKLGFIAGWVMLLDYMLIPLLLYIVSANYAHALLPMIPYWAWILIFVIPVTIVNYRGVEVAAKVNLIITVVLFASVLAFIIAAVGYAEGNSIPVFQLSAIYNSDTFSVTGVVAGAAMAVLSYLGFDGITTLSEEANVSSAKIKKAIIAACGFQTIIFVAIAYFATMYAPDYTAFKDIDTIFYDITYQVGGTALQLFVTFVIVISGPATALAGQSSASRLLFGMGRDNLISKKLFAHVHPKYKTPSYSIIIMGLLGAVGGMTVSMEIVTDIVTFGGLIGFICVNFAVFYYFALKKGELKLLSNIIFPSLGVLSCGYILFNLSDIGKIVGFSWMGLGIVYLAVRSLQSSQFRQLLINKNELVQPETVLEKTGI